MITVSIVDDESKLRESIATFVNGSPGFKCVSSYGSAAAALKNLPSDKPAVDAAGEKTGQLSPREQAVLDGLAKGWTYKQLASELEISIDTIRTYIRRIYEKLHVQSRTEAVAKYLQS